jgi:hypothetical protein
VYIVGTERNDRRSEKRVVEAKYRKAESEPTRRMVEEEAGLQRKKGEGRGME